MTERAAWWAAVAAVAAILLSPLLIADVPPVLDYPNHLARLVLLAAGSDNPVATPNWTIIPNLAGDAIGLALLRFLPTHVAGRCLLGGVLLLNLAGVLALHRAWFGRRSFWPLGSGLVAYNSGFLLGFLNWQIGCGLAMLSAAGWMRWRDQRPRATLACAMAAAVVLFFCHLMGLLFFIALIGAAELCAMRTRRAAGLLAVLTGPTLLWLFTALRETPAAPQWPRADVKLVNAASPFINYSFVFDISTTVVIYVGIGVGIAAGWLVVERRAVPLMAALPIAYCVLPFDLMGAAFLDMRIALMFGFLLFAAVTPVRVGDNRTAWRVVAFGCAALFVARMAVVAEAWREHRRDLAAVRAVIAQVPPGARVYVTNIPQEEAPAYWDAGPLARRLSNGLRADYHLPALLLIEHGAFWPGLFANPAQQPIRLRPDYARLAREADAMPSHAALLADPDRALPMLRDFDFVLMLEAGAGDPARFLPGCLMLMAESDFAAMFKVIRDATDCASRPQ